MDTKVTHHDLATVPSVREELISSNRHNEAVQDVSLPKVAADIDSDEFEEEDVSSDPDNDADSVIGVSMSKMQHDMKSPTTPAASKAQAMEWSRDYFEINRDEQDILMEEPVQDGISKQELEDPHLGSKAQSEPVPKAPPQPSSPSHVAVKGGHEEAKQNDKRSSLIATIFGSTSSGVRQRSSSGSSIVDNIRKRVPNMPTFTFPKSFGHGEQNSRCSTWVSADRGSTDVPPATKQRLKSQHNHDFQNLKDQTDSQETLLPENDHFAKQQSSLPVPGKGLLRRTTSDQSLYLRKAPTGASEFDDYTAFANVSEMVNSRFKAITDSLQDSSLRRARILSRTGGDGGSRSNNLNPDRIKFPRGLASTSQVASSTEPLQKAQVEANGTRTSSKHPILKGVLSQLTGDLVVMGGYRGSVLREAQPPNRQLWVPIKVGMNLRKADLEVGLAREDELRMDETIIADGALSHIGPVDICRRLLRKCSRCPNVRSGVLRLHNYGYDWRLSPDLLSDRLTKFLESLPCNQPETPIAQRGAWLVAHSLGGLLTRHVINSRPDLVAGVVYAGAPQNCCNILGPLRNGDDVLFSSRVLTAQVNFTLRTSYALLPQNGRCFINKQTGERYDIDFFSAKTWDDYCLTPCIKGPLSRQKPEKRTSLIGSISEAIAQPARYGSAWFSSSSENKENHPAADAKAIAEDAIDHVADATEVGKPERPLSPTMADGSSRNQKPAVATTSTIPLAAATKYLERTLASVLQFKQELSHKASLQDDNAYPPAAVLFAKNTPTVYGAFVSSREDIKYDDAFDDLAFAAGDGVVLASAAQLPVGYRCVRGGRVESDRGHVGLLGDLEGVGKCLAAVLEGRKRGVGVGAYQPKKPINSPKRDAS